MQSAVVLFEDERGDRVQSHLRCQLKFASDLKTNKSYFLLSCFHNFNIFKFCYCEKLLFQRYVTVICSYMQLIRRQT